MTDKGDVSPSVKQKQLQEALRKAEHEKALIVENMTELVVYLSPDMRIIWANRAAADSVGLTPDDLVGRYCYKVWHQRNVPCEVCHVIDARDTGRPQTGEVVSPDGRAWRIKGNPIKDEKDRVIGIVELTEDITERKRAEEVLYESRERFRNLVETTSDWVWETDENIVFTYVSPKVRDILGYEPEELLGKTPFELMLPEDARRVADAAKDIATSKKPFSFLENANIHKDGHLVTLETSGVPFFDKAGKFRGYRGIDRDITERKRSEEAVLKEKEFTDVAIDAQRDTFFVFNPATKKAIRWNKAFNLVSGYSDREISELKAPNSYYSPEDLKKAAKATEEILKGEEYVFEMSLITKDGKKIPFEYSGAIIPGEKDDEQFIVSIGRDITERNKAEESLRKSEEKYRSLVSNIPDVVWTTDYKGNTTYISPNVEDVYGYSPDEIYSAGSDLWFGRIHSDDVETVKNAFAKLFEEGTPLDVEYRIRRKDDEWIWLRDRSIGTYEKDGLKLANGVFYDITERKQAKEALKESEERFRNLAERSLVGVYLIQEGDVKYANPKIREIFGLTPEEIIDKNFADKFILPEDRPMVEENLRKRFSGEVDAIRYEFRGIRKDKKIINVEAFGAAIMHQGRPAIIGTLIDITERKRAERKLNEAFEEIKRLKEQLEAENIYLREEVQTIRGHEKIVGESEAIRGVLIEAEQVAVTDSTVLMLGETGTGKELLARAIHDMSSRRNRAFVAVNCAAIPPTLLESELFGRERGAYTGALSRQAGRFEVADRSTIFLDEVGELPPEAQAKLLRVLQEGKFERLGSTKTIEVDVRVIAASNQDMEDAVRSGKFREDLFYRLNVFPITVPPLRERKEDIPSLVWFFVKELSESMGKKIERISRKTMEELQSYPWPGNVRELKNIIERSIILTKGPALKVELPSVTSSMASKARTLDEVQREHIRSVLDQTGWRVRGKNGAADVLGLKPSTLESRMAKLGIKRKS
jgi:PAS domain S-box-containing protein